MQPLRWARVVYARQAYAMIQTMGNEHRRLFDAAIAAIKNGPDDGQFVAKEADGTIIRQFSAQDVHVQYAVKFWTIGRVLLVTLIEIRHWEPLDDSPPLGTRLN
ncbi:MAG: hypothetical protein EI684_18070 [Candidatus Viridilinea halotolerans]|uniref:Type II toxin-antitoxin system RelE/ParE family toxin n=1 Tax=Candidatus Viridilinea halotolerans TaxID=2491704 RepID=A0A426TTK0_9CHLR|nr:MAG: hypothetical protein EI684_18070 [Candidatus Viridilinea halotolerans]